MKLNIPHRFTPLKLFAVTLSLGSQTVQGGVATDPTLYDIIDPIGSVEVNITAPGSTPKTVLQEQEGFGVIQTFTGFTGGTNVVSFTDPNQPDIQISFSGDYGSSRGDNFTNADFVTSGSSGIRIPVSNSYASTGLSATIDFGEWDGESFDSNINSVAAAGFTIGAPTERFDRITSISAQFLDPEAGVLTTQTITTSALSGSSQGLYFGYAAESGSSIGSIVLTVNVSVGSAELTPLLGLDDIGYTPIPEPSSSSLALILSVLLVGITFRRPHSHRNR